MGLLNQKGKGASKKSGKQQSNAQASKFINKAGKPTSGGGKKPMTGGTQRGS